MRTSSPWRNKRSSTFAREISGTAGRGANWMMFSVIAPRCGLHQIPHTVLQLAAAFLELGNVGNKRRQLLVHEARYGLCERGEILIGEVGRGAARMAVRIAVAVIGDLLLRRRVHHLARRLTQNVLAPDYLGCTRARLGCIPRLEFPNGIELLAQMRQRILRSRWKRNGHWLSPN